MLLSKTPEDIRSITLKEMSHLLLSSPYQLLQTSPSLPPPPHLLLLFTSVSPLPLSSSVLHPASSSHLLTTSSKPLLHLLHTVGVKETQLLKPSSSLSPPSIYLSTHLLLLFSITPPLPDYSLLLLLITTSPPSHFLLSISSCFLPTSSSSPPPPPAHYDPSSPPKTEGVMSSCCHHPRAAAGGVSPPCLPLLAPPSATDVRWELKPSSV